MFVKLVLTSNFFNEKIVIITPKIIQEQKNENKMQFTFNFKIVIMEEIRSKNKNAIDENNDNFFMYIFDIINNVIIPKLAKTKLISNAILKEKILCLYSGKK